MERTSAELKRLAREKLAGHWGLVIGAILLQALIVVAILLPFEFLFIFSGGGMVQFVAYLVAAMILGIISTIMQCGITRMMLCFARGQQAGIGMMFGEFTKRPDRYIVGTLLMFGIEMACLLQPVLAGGGPARPDACQCHWGCPVFGRGSGDGSNLPALWACIFPAGGRSPDGSLRGFPGKRPPDGWKERAAVLYRLKLYRHVSSWGVFLRPWDALGNALYGTDPG